MVTLLGVCVLLAGCGATSSTGSRPIHVIASFYPLLYVTERIGGDRVSVQNLTPTGAEPHEIELSASTSGDIEDAGLVVYLHGLAPAVDEAVADVAGHHGLDVTPEARVDLHASGQENGGGNSGRDLHFWLDPTRLADVAGAIAARLGQIDPSGVAAFDANAAALKADLHTLDQQYQEGLAHCANRVVVTGHEAFAYLAERYDLAQVGVTGLTPDEEPSPADLARVSRYVEQHHVTTIYTESLVSPAVAATVAAETGASTAVLDPLEGLSKANRGSDYLGIMRANLTVLRSGLGCA